ncbi:MAG: type II toxin-antitoxin system PemK/MazF family toxin [Bacteroidetes bacterium]|nr:type II toxin-antitoxin system PemK/MazF family toxin [Bacteroidota bacterium]
MERSMKGDVVIIPFPFSDLSGAKRRPALVIADWGGDDLILCQITSKSKNDGYEVELDPSGFTFGNLPVISNIRPNKIFTAARTTILTTRGHISDQKYRQVYQKLKLLFKL